MWIFEEAIGLLELIQAVNAVKGIERIRLGSLEPKIVTEHFASELSKLDKICPHFHLSLQSGCDATLKRMNRNIPLKSTREAVSFCVNILFIRPSQPM
mgnify:FL=1